MATTKVIICLDGCAPDYIAASDTPNLDALAREGCFIVGRAVMPTVTNVNNTSIVTAQPPAKHGITANYYQDLASGQGVYMESPDFIQAETIFQFSARTNKKSALLTAKTKLKTLIQTGADLAESAQNPAPWLVDLVGPPPDIYSLEVNHWLFKAALAVLMADSPPEVMYISTTDYAQHKFAPESEQSQWNINQIDYWVGELLNLDPAIELVITADHGMNPKRRVLNLKQVLHKAGMEAVFVPIIKDRYVVHHQNLGGSAYIYLEDPALMKQAREVLNETPGVDAVYSAEEAVLFFKLHPKRIGHLFVLADADTVFGEMPGLEQTVDIRSHGSLYEEQVPIYVYGNGPRAARPRTNDQIAQWIFRQG